MTTKNMNAKLTRTTYLRSPGTAILHSLYMSKVKQNVAFTYLLGNQNYMKRILNYEKNGGSTGY